MKQGWEVKKLTDICDVFADGDWIESKDQSLEGIRLIQTGNIGNGFFKDRGEKARYISEDTFKRLRCTEILEGDCLLSRLPDPVGRACILPDTNEKMITAVDCTIMRFQTNLLFPQWFILYSLSKGYQDQINDQITGATRQRISRKNLGQISIPLPPLPEQQRIVAILDEAFTAIERAKVNAMQNLKNAKELFDSYLQSVFEKKGEGWKRVKVDEICESIIDCINKTAPIVTEQTPYKMIRTTNVRFGKVDLTNVRYVTEKTYIDWTRRQKPKIGDILFTREAPMGEVGMLLSDDNVFLGQRIVSYRIDDSKVDGKFLLYGFQSNDLKNQIRKLASGATVQHLRVPDTKSFEFSIPTLAEQQTIVQKLDLLSAETKRLEAIYQQKIDNLEELKKSILQKAFNGEL